MLDKVYNWLQNHSWCYGFILRYPSDKTDITGVGYDWIPFSGTIFY